MRKKNYHGRCTKQALPKLKDVCRTYDNLMEVEAKMLVADESVETIRYRR